jgi:peptide/nickel transport system permease protein
MQDQETVQEAVLAGGQASVGRAGGSLPPVETHEVAVKQLGQWGLVWRRFTRHRLALAGGWILLGIVILAIVGPWFAPPTPHTLSDFLIQINRGQPPRLWPLDLNRLMGTDYYTNPVSGYVLAGARPALTIGFLGAFIASVIGIIIGSIAGYFGRFVDTVLMRLTDAFLTVPFFPLVYLLTFYLPEQTTITFAVLMGVVGWGGVARLVRSYVLSLGQREFAEAARALGASDLGIIFRHLLPNALDILIVSFTLNIALFLVTAANLGDLGAWVATMSIGYDALNWWQVVFPGFCLLLTIVSVNFLGDGLRDAFDTTNSGALIRWKDRPERSGKLWQAIAATAQLSARPLLAARSMAGTVAGATLVRRPARRWVPASRATAVRGGRLARPLARLIAPVERLPVAIRLIPPLAVMVALMPVFLLGHSPLRYAPHFATPQPLVTEEENTEYGAHPLPGGAWTLFAGDAQGAPTFTKVDAAGRVILRQRIAAEGNELSMASRHGWALGVWINPDSTRVMAAFLGRHRGRPFPLVPPGGQVDHPYVTVAPGGFDVVFQWQPAFDQQADYRIYLAYVRRGAHRPAVVRRIAATPDYGFYPRAVIDGSGALDVLYLSRVKINQWSLDFRRFRPDGTPLERARTVGTVCYKCGIVPAREIIPYRWEIDMKRAPDGSVWAVWDASPAGDDTLNIGHWDRHGHFLLFPKMLGAIPKDPVPSSAVALALFRRGGQLYYSGPNPDGGVGSVTWMQAFDEQGSLVGAPQRVNYDSGGSSSLPRAGTIRGHTMVVWARVRAGPTFLEASSYHAHATPPDLLVRLGLNVGTPWINVGLLLVGALAGGFGIAIVNIFLLLILVALWLPIGRLVPRPLHWPVYFAALAAVIVDVFGVHGADLPQWVIMISGLGSPENWAAVAGAIAVTGWAGLFLFRRVEPLFRAAAMSFTAVYVMAVMYAVNFIQGEITRI